MIIDTVDQETHDALQEAADFGTTADQVIGSLSQALSSLSSNKNITLADQMGQLHAKLGNIWNDLQDVERTVRGIASAVEVEALDDDTDTDGDDEDDVERDDEPERDDAVLDSLYEDTYGEY